MFGTGATESTNQYFKKPEVYTSLVFDGTGGSYVQINNPLSSQTNTAQEWTVIADIKIEETGSDQFLVSGMNNGLKLVQATTKKPLLYINSGAIDDYYNYGLTSVSDGIGHKVAFAFKNSTGTKNLYLDGADNTNTAGPNKTSTPNGLQSTFKIGLQIKGTIANVQIWNRLLTQAEIQQYSNMELLGTESGLVGYYKLNEGAGTKVLDYSPTKNHGTISGAVWQTTKKSTSFLSLNGTSDYVSVPNSSSLNITGSFTIKCKVKVKVLPIAGTENNFVEKNGYSQFRIGVTPAGLLHTTLQVTDGTTATYVNDYSNLFYPVLNQWYTYHYVFDADAKMTYMYIDGKLQGSKSTPAATVVASSSPVYFGRYTNYFSNMDIDHAEIWNVSMTAEDVMKSYEVFAKGTESGLVGCWHMDEAVGTTVRDKTANKNNGTIYGAKWSPYKNDAIATNFNGTTDRIDITYANNSMTGMANLTVEAWVKLQAGSTYQRIVSIWSPQPAWEFFVYNNGTGTPNGEICLELKCANGTGWSHHGANLYDGKEHHVAGVYDGVNRIVYIDGIEVGRDASAWGNVVNVTTTDMTIGSYNGNLNGANCKGTVRDVRIWNVARSATDIQVNMNRELTGREAGLIGYYKLDRGVGNIAVDSSVNKQHGRLASTITWNKSLPKVQPFKVSFSPRDIDTLSLWLDASKITVPAGAAIPTWYDLSGGGKHATQSTTASQPLFQNGSVLFDGVDDYLSLPSVANARHIFIVSKVTKSGWSTFVSRAYGQDIGIRTANGAGFALPGNTNDFYTTNVATQVWVNGTQTSTFTNGSRFISSVISTNQETIGALGVGYTAGLPSDNRLLGGEISEIVVYNKVLTTTERKKVEFYLASKWGLTGLASF
jgi:hypothetical protein